MGALFQSATEFWSLRSAARRAFKGVRKSPQACGFVSELEQEVLSLQQELRGGGYRPGPFHTFPIRDPKPRIISVAPFRDRVVHHALCAAMDPLLEGSADPDSYACRKGKGALAAIRRVQEHARQHRFFARFDILHCFETVDVGVLSGLLERSFPDPALLEVLDRILQQGASEGRGLPIGNLTSQHLANFLLGEMDRAARSIGVGAWMRYMDDMYLFGDDLPVLEAQLHYLLGVLAVRLKQREKQSVRRIGPVSAGVPALGFRVWPQRVRLDGARRRRFLGTLRGLERGVREGVLSEAEAVRAAVSVIGWAQHADTRGLRCSLVVCPPQVGRA